MVLGLHLNIIELMQESGMVSIRRLQTIGALLPYHVSCANLGQTRCVQIAKWLRQLLAQSEKPGFDSQSSTNCFLVVVEFFSMV